MNMRMVHKYPVKVVMVSYNQENFIAQAIESVLNQKTNFTYRLIIGDDCSTDSTSDIITQYADRHPDKITFIRNKENRGLLLNYKQLLNSFPTQFVALLEGDDYWTDENKLQTQFDLLNNNPDIGLVHTDCDLLFESGKLQKGSHQRHIESIKNKNVFEQLLHENYIRPATVMFRQKLYDKYVPIDEYIRLGFKTIDYPMWLDISAHAHFHYLSNSSAVYRIHSSSISNSNQYEKTAKFFKSISEIKNYALEKSAYNMAFRKALINSCLIDQITIEMEFQNYETVSKMIKDLIILNFRSFAIRLLASHRYMINIYAHYLKYRGNMQRA